MLQEPTYFFITAYDCDEGCEAEVDPNLSSTVHCQGPLDLRYKLEMTNGRNGGGDFPGTETGLYEAAFRRLMRDSRAVHT